LAFLAFSLQPLASTVSTILPSFATPDPRPETPDPWRLVSPPASDLRPSIPKGLSHSVPQPRDRAKWLRWVGNQIVSPTLKAVAASRHPLPHRTNIDAAPIPARMHPFCVRQMFSS